MDLRNRTVLITGGTSGIGAELVALLAPHNDKIIILGRHRERMQGIVDQHDNVDGHVVYLEHPSEWVPTWEAILETYPNLSVVINNAAVQYVPLISTDEFSLDSVSVELTVNLQAPITICALTLRHFLGQDGPTAFVNITSGLAFYPKTTSSVYCATKAALHSFSQSFRYQTEGTNVSVIEAVLPLVDTPMTAGRGTHKLAPDVVAQQIIQGIERGNEEIYVGKARFIPILSRIWPSLIKRILKNG